MPTRGDHTKNPQKAGRETYFICTFLPLSKGKDAHFRGCMTECRFLCQTTTADLQLRKTIFGFPHFSFCGGRKHKHSHCSGFFCSTRQSNFPLESSMHPALSLIRAKFGFWRISRLSCRFFFSFLRSIESTFSPSHISLRWNTFLRCSCLTPPKIRCARYSKK